MYPILNGLVNGVAVFAIVSVVSIDSLASAMVISAATIICSTAGFVFGGLSRGGI